MQRHGLLPLFVALTSVVITLNSPPATAQVAVTFLDTFQKVCLPELTFERTVAEFKASGWKSPEDALHPLYAQDITKPDQKAYFVFDEPTGGKVLGAAFSERRGLLITRHKTTCLVRAFLEAPSRLRKDFRKLLKEPPSRSTSNQEILADAWLNLLKGRVFGFRAIKTKNGFWIVTAYRVLTSG
ncbi:MAG: hypothetical protein AAF732_17395 [Pseudomonadota bacterium]